MTKLSVLAWKKTEKVIEATKTMKFNTELAKGILDIDRFAYYIEQDLIYLQDYTRVFNILSTKSPFKYMQDFVEFENLALIAEKELVHDYFKQKYSLKVTSKITPATLAYTGYLYKAALTMPFAVGIAAILPCFWVYKEVGHAVASLTVKDNPYINWIEAYTSEEFAKVVDRAIEIFDEVAQEQTEEVKEQMLEAFYNSSLLEWHFWNDSYNFKNLDDLTQFSS